jgi:dihydrodipicolinate synthase/N-acetylneuraminate lyase
VPGTSVGIRKEILRRRGWIASARVRPPAPVLDAETLDELTDLLAAVGAPAER